MPLTTNNAQAIWGTAGTKQYELTNHLGNVLATISNRHASATGDADVITQNDYYPFGMLQNGRSYTATGAGNYRYGFNGKENDNEVKKDASGNDIVGAQQDYGMRIYDPRVGRFLSTDPITESFPQLSPFQFGSNRPIDGIDFDGKEWIPYRKWDEDYKNGGILAVFANVTTNTVLGAVNAVAGLGLGVKNISVYTYKFAKGSVNPKRDAVTVYKNSKSKISNFVNQPTGKIAHDVFDAATSPDAYGAAVGFFSLGGGKLFFSPVVELGQAAKVTLDVLKNDASRAASFSGGKYAISTAAEDITVYRVSGGTSGSSTGEFFSLVKPNTIADAEKMLNINAYGNTGEFLTPVVIKKGSQFAIGGVEGGTGTQVFIPAQVQNNAGNSVIRLLDKTTALPK